jgi:cytochrome P450
VLVELAKNIAVQTQLREELLMRRASQDPADKQQHVDNSLMRRVIKETMRLWPVAAGGGARVVPEDMFVTRSSNDGSGEERPMKIPKGSISILVSYSIMRDRDTFDRPDEWLPDRWKNPTQDMKTAFIPFMVGRRSVGRGKGRGKKELAAPASFDEDAPRRRDCCRRRHRCRPPPSDVVVVVVLDRRHCQ